MNEFKNSLICELCKNNSTLVQLLGLCPLLAITSTATNAVCLGLATTIILIITNSIISILRHWIPNEVRLPIYVMIIASVVTCIQMLINSYMYDLYHSIGIFIPLISTNCIVLGRAEVIASKRNILISVIDGFIIGINITIIMFLLGSLREIIGNGTIFNDAEWLLGSWAKVLRVEVLCFHSPMLLAILPPGAFIILGILLAMKYFCNQKLKICISIFHNRNLFIRSKNIKKDKK